MEIPARITFLRGKIGINSYCYCRTHDRSIRTIAVIHRISKCIRIVRIIRYRWRCHACTYEITEQCITECIDILVDLVLKISEEIYRSCICIQFMADVESSITCIHNDFSLRISDKRLACSMDIAQRKVFLSRAAYVLT